MMRMMVPFLLIEDDQLTCAMCLKRMNREEVQILMEKKGSAPWKQTWTAQNVFCNECALIMCKEAGDIAMQ